MSGPNPVTQGITSSSVTPPAPKKDRLPQPGDAIVFTGWTDGETDRPGFAAHCVADKATLSYMTKSGAWMSAHLAPYDPTGKAPGSWRWRR